MQAYKRVRSNFIIFVFKILIFYLIFNNIILFKVFGNTGRKSLFCYYEQNTVFLEN